MKRSVFIALALVAMAPLALASCNTSGNASEPQPAVERLAPTETVARLEYTEVGHFCHSGNSVYVATKAGYASSIAVIEDADECVGK